MYGEFEILRMVTELRHAELLAAAYRAQQLKTQHDCQPGNALYKSAIVEWLGSHFPKWLVTI